MFECDGALVVVDNVSLDLIRGSEVDYKEVGLRKCYVNSPGIDSILFSNRE